MKQNKQLNNRPVFGQGENMNKKEILLCFLMVLFLVFVVFKLFNEPVKPRKFKEGDIISVVIDGTKGMVVGDSICGLYLVRVSGKCMSRYELKHMEEYEIRLR
jgi:hypothetical protein